jgi:hypothetical protein
VPDSPARSQKFGSEFQMNKRKTPRSGSYTACFR